MKKLARSTLLLLITLYTFQAYGTRLSKVIVNGNTKTRTAIIQQEMLLIRGAEITPDALEKSRQAIMDLGLFESVQVSMENTDQNGVVVVTVKEKKHDWYVLPRIDRNGDGDIALGVNWRENNLMGLNQTSRFTLKHKKFKDAAKDKEISARWKFEYPRIVNTQLSTFIEAHVLHVGLEEQRNNLSGSYDRQEYLLGLGIGKWFSAFGASKGLHALAGIEFNRFEHEFKTGQPGFYDDASFISLIAEISYRQIADKLFSREGYALGLRLKRAFRALGSNREFFYQQFYYRHYKPITQRTHTNFNFQVQLASGDNSLFGDPIYELSGQQTLRGYPRETLEGDAYLLVNTEILTPVFGRDNVRAAAFLDFGNAYNSLTDVADLKLESGIGFGIRWKFKRWVGAELRIDFARGLGDQGETRIYAASEATF